MNLRYLSKTMFFFVFSIGCGGNETSENQTKTNSVSSNQAPKNQQNQRNQQKQPIKSSQKGIAGLSKSENLQSAWKETLAVSFDIVGVKQDDNTLQQCGDADQDGFFDVLKCPWLSSKQGDCDDKNSSVTPTTEIWIPASPFLMGSESDHAGRDEKPMHVVFMDGYCLDRNEVRVEDFAHFIKTTNRTAQGADLRSMSVDGTVERGRENHPIEGVTFEEARDYCSFYGKRLPTEAEFEKASRGGCELGTDSQKCDREDLRAYPWGNSSPTCEFANHQLSTEGFPKLCVSDTVEVDAQHAQVGPYGHAHLSGNVWEYALDFWHPTVYSSQEQRTNPAGIKDGTIHVLRGGGWNTFSTNMRASNRFHDLVMGSASGFRCVRSTASLNYDDVEPLEMIRFSGVIQAGDLEKLEGRALYVSVFDAEDADSNGMVAPGRSPVAEIKLSPNQENVQKFELDVPKGSSYFVSAALDGGSGAQKDNYVSASGSGGFGRFEQKIDASENRENLEIVLKKAPQMPIKKNSNTNGTPFSNHPQHNKGTRQQPMQHQKQFSNPTKKAPTPKK